MNAPHECSIDDGSSACALLMSDAGTMGCQLVHTALLSFKVLGYIYSAVK